MRRGPRRIWHRGRGRGSRGWSSWAQIAAMGIVLIVIFGYIIKLFFFSPADAGGLQVLLPLVMR